MKKLMILSVLLLTFLSSDLYGQDGPRGARSSPRSQRGRMISPHRRGTGFDPERARQAWLEWKRQIEAGWEEKRIANERYGNALRREREAQRQAEYAERYFPNTAISRSYRQAANAASMNRVREEDNRRNRLQESMRRWGVTPPEYMRSRRMTGTERRESPQSGKGDLPFSRNSDNRRDPSDRTERTISGFGYGPRVTDKIQDRLPAARDNDHGGRTGRSSDSGSTRGSSRGDRGDWRDSKP
jgi:hypothetical protein